MKNIATLLIVLFVCNITTAQNYKFGKVSKEELQEKFNPLDSSANAAYLYKYRNTSFRADLHKGLYLFTEIHERIKVYNQKGFDYATKEVRLYGRGDAEEKLIGLKAYTYNLIGNDIEGDKLKKNEVFKTEISRYNNSVKFTMPNIKEGSIIEYKYSISSPFIFNVDEFVFQHDIPIKKLNAKFNPPEYLVFKTNPKGFLKLKPKRGSKMSYSLIDIPALKQEPYVNNINNYRSAIKYELSATLPPYSTVKEYSTSWESVVKTIYKSPNFGTELDKSNYYKDDVDALINTVSDPKKRMVLIFDFVKSKVKWNNYYGKYTSDGVKKAYKEQVGNAAEINLMLTSMLRYAGLKANPVLVSTRENGIPLFPTREGYNYVVTYVRFPEATVLLDATNKYSEPNVLPFRTLNWQGRVIAKHGGSTLIDLYPKENSKNSISMMAKLSEEGDIEGGYRSVKTNHKALSYREQYNNADENDFLEKLENKYDGLEVSDFKVSNAVELSKPVVESYKFFKESQSDIIGDKIYFSPLFFLRSKENPFKLEKREFPVDFGYPSSNTYRIMISLPEGYKVESMPESSAFALPDNLGSFRYMLSQKESTIQLLIDTKINTSIISPLYYDTLKAYFKQLIEKENEQIVLTKV